MNAFKVLQKEYRIYPLEAKGKIEKTAK